MSPSSRTLLFLFTFTLLFSHLWAHGGHDDDADAETDSNDAPVDLRARPLILAKVWCLIVIFFATFVSGVSPYVLKWNEGFLVVGTQFAGGVFLGTAMMHFLSDANETFGGDLTTKEYPFAFMLACAGYLMTMLADSVISSILEKAGRDGDAGDVEIQGRDTSKVSTNGVTSQSQNRNLSISSTDHNFASPALASAHSLGDTILLIVALCAHSVFEGLAIGVAETKADAWKALWTICLHKIFAAIAMGIALLRMIPNRPLMSCAAYAFAFAISSPIGVAIGIILDATTQGHVADWIFAISMGLACGVFIYVSVNHLLAKGYKPHNPTKVDSAYFKFFAVLLGVGVIAVVMIWFMGVEVRERVLQGEELSVVLTKINMVDLPLGATEDRVCGTIDIEKALTEGVKAFEPGLLAKANRGILYVDEVNLLDDHLVDVLLDSAASGWNTVEREGISISHPARFILIGSGNPEEGELRPQLLDRFGMHAQVGTVRDAELRVKIVEERGRFDKNPKEFRDTYKAEQDKLQDQITSARSILSSVQIDQDLKVKISRVCAELNVDGLRGDIVTNRAAKALAALKGRDKVSTEDIATVIPNCLRHRLRKDPLESIDSGLLVTEKFYEVFS